MHSRSAAQVLGVALLCVMAAACSNSNTTPPSSPSSPTCTVTAAAGTTSYAAAGGTGSVTVTAGTGCAWTATASANFVTITAGSSGSGNGTVSYTVAANTGAARTGTLTVGTTSFTISQSAASAPTGTLATPTANSPVAGASVSNGNPTLVVNNAAATGNVGTVTYRFEVSDQPTFPNDPVRTFTADGVAQGSGSTTSWTVTGTLGNDVLWYWHARATNGTVTTDYSPTETFRTPASCTVTVPSAISVANGASNANIAVSTSTPTCAWTATSNAPFITITSGGSGTGNGTIAIAIAANNTGAARTGTISVNSQTITVSQPANAGISASFIFEDPGVSGAAPVMTCKITSNIATTCTLMSTSFPLGTNTLVKYDWTASFFDGQTRSFAQTGSNPQFNFVWSCGGPNSSDPPGTAQPLSVTLTVTDDQGNTATVSAGSGGQPPLTVTLFKC